jgi:hypothetical protein
LWAACSVGQLATADAEFTQGTELGGFLASGRRGGS